MQIGLRGRLGGAAVVAALAITGQAVAATAATAPTAHDYTGDGRADIAIERVEESSFFWPGGGEPFVGGLLGFPASANWVADGTATDPVEAATFDIVDGTWSVPALGTTFGFGRTGDTPLPGNWRGTPDAEAAVFRASTGQWFVRGAAGFGFGRAGDVAVPFDADGDGDLDAAVFRPSTGQWFVRGGVQGVAFGRSGDVPVPADYDGDGRVDLAVYRIGTGQWFVRGVASLSGVGFGRAGNDLPVPADYDGDGRTDLAVWRVESGTWFVRGRAPQQFGRPLLTSDSLDLPARIDVFQVLFAETGLVRSPALTRVQVQAASVR